MAYWMTSTQIAAKYEVTEQEVFSWAELKEISSAHINHTLMIDDDSVQFYLGTHKMLAEKQAIRERLIAEEDKIIGQELKKYDDAALLIRLQSECIPLYDLLIKILAAMIPNIQERKLFCAITGAYSLEQIPKYYGMSDENKFKAYLEIVHKLHADLKYILIMQKEVGEFLEKSWKGTRAPIPRSEEEYDNWKLECERLISKLDDREREKEEWILPESELRRKMSELQEKELQIHQMLYNIKKILKSREENAENYVMPFAEKKEDHTLYQTITAWIIDVCCHLKENIVCKFH